VLVNEQWCQYDVVDDEDNQIDGVYLPYMQNVGPQECCAIGIRSDVLAQHWCEKEDEPESKIDKVFFIIA
jgi:hypothetical protein